MINKPKARIKLIVEPLIDEGYGKIGQKSEFSFNIFNWIDIVLLHIFLEKFIAERMEGEGMTIKCRICDGKMEINYDYPAIDTLPEKYTWECEKCHYTMIASKFIKLEVEDEK